MIPSGTSISTSLRQPLILPFFSDSGNCFACLGGAQMAIGGSLWSLDEESELDVAFCGTAGAAGGGRTGGCSVDWLEEELHDDDFLAAGDDGWAAGLAGANDDDDEPEDPEEMEGCNSFTTAGLCRGGDCSTGEGFGSGGATFGDRGLLDDFSAEAAVCGGPGETAALTAGSASRSAFGLVALISSFNFASSRSRFVKSFFAFG
jgi:hypothetical protein